MRIGISLPLGKYDFPSHEVLYLSQYFSSSCYFKVGNSSFSAVILCLDLSQITERLKVLRVVHRQQNQRSWKNWQRGRWALNRCSCSQVSRTYAKAFLETFCIRDPLKYLPRTIGGGGKKRVSRMSWQKPLPVPFTLLHLMYVIPGQLRAQWSRLKTAQDPVPKCPLCSSCLLFLSDFRKLVRYKTRNNRSGGRNPGSSVARWYSSASCYWSLNFSTRADEIIVLLPTCSLLDQ